MMFLRLSTKTQPSLSSPRRQCSDRQFQHQSWCRWYITKPFKCPEGVGVDISICSISTVGGPPNPLHNNYRFLMAFDFCSRPFLTCLSLRFCCRGEVRVFPAVVRQLPTPHHHHPNPSS